MHIVCQALFWLSINFFGVCAFALLVKIASKVAIRTFYEEETTRHLYEKQALFHHEVNASY